MHFIHQHALRLRSVWGIHGLVLGVSLSHFTVQLERPCAREICISALWRLCTRTLGSSPGPKAQVTGAGGAPACRLGCCCLADPLSSLWTLLSTRWVFSSYIPFWPGLLILACIWVKYVRVESIQSRDPRSPFPVGRPLRSQQAHICAPGFPRSGRAPPPSTCLQSWGQPWPSYLSPALATWLSLSLLAHNLCRLFKH